jgi:hypothetical protein
MARSDEFDVTVDVSPETLTDGSVAYNVCIVHWDVMESADTGMTLPARNRRSANALARNIAKMIEKHTACSADAQDY